MRRSSAVHRHYDREQLWRDQRAGRTGSRGQRWRQFRLVPLDRSDQRSVFVQYRGSAIDTLLAVYTGASVSALTLVAGNDDSAFDLTSAVSVQATDGSRTMWP